MPGDRIVAKAVEVRTFRYSTLRERTHPRAFRVRCIQPLCHLS